MSEFDLHKTEGLCSHCGAVIVCRCCGPFEGEWRVEFDAWGDVCPARPDTGPLEHEPRRSNDGRLLPPSEVRSTDTTNETGEDQ